MTISNISKPTTSLVNPTKVVGYETWDSNTTTWDTETRNWNEMGTTWNNSDKLFSVYDGMTSYWKLDETSGNVVDYVNGYTLVNTGVTFAAGKINNGGVFNGSPAKLVSATELNLFSPRNFSLSVWFKRGGTPSSARAILAQYSAMDVMSLQFGIGVGQVRLVRYDASGTAIETILSGGSYVDNVWHHTVITFDYLIGTKIYIDGTLVKTGTNTTLGNVIPSITAIGFMPTVFSSGSIDEVGTWNTVLTPDDVVYLYNSTNGRQPPFTVNYSKITNIDKP